MENAKENELARNHRNMSPPSDYNDPAIDASDRVHRNTIFQQSTIKIQMRMPNMIQNLIRPGAVPFSFGLRRPASLDKNAVPRDCNETIKLSVSRIIHHDEHAFQYSPQVEIRFYAVEEASGRHLPKTSTLNSSTSPELTSSHLKTSDDGNSYHQLDCDLCVNYDEILSTNSLLLFELTGSNIPSAGVKKAWAFFRPKRTLADFLSKDKSTKANNRTKKVELQLYKWQKGSLLVRKQVEHHILTTNNNARRVPEVFIQYLMQRRKRYDSSMSLKVHNIPVANKVDDA